MSILYRSPNSGLFGESRIDYDAAANSYSADTIGMNSKVRRPFEMDGSLWVCTGSVGSFTRLTSIEIYKLTPARDFDGTPTSYRNKIDIDGGYSARADPMGFYHGMTVQHSGKDYVLTGPEYELLSEPVQVRARADEDEDAAIDDAAADFALDFVGGSLELGGDQMTLEGISTGQDSLSQRARDSKQTTLF